MTEHRAAHAKGGRVAARSSGTAPLATSPIAYQSDTGPTPSATTEHGRIVADGATPTVLLLRGSNRSKEKRITVGDPWTAAGGS